MEPSEKGMDAEKVENSFPAPLEISLFGPFDVRVEGTPLPHLRSRKGQWLLALLTLRPNREIQRSWLAGMLWPDSPEAQAFASLRQSLTDLRRALGSQAYRLQTPTPQTVLFDLNGAKVDVYTFDRGIKQNSSDSLEAAVAACRGMLLEGCSEEWVIQERVTREQAFLNALETLAAQAMAAGNPTVAVGYLRRALTADPLSEGTHCHLMRALATAGNYAEVVLAYRELRLLLRREMNLDPSPETAAVFQAIRAEARKKGSASLPTTAPPTPVKPTPLPEATPRRIPRPLTPLIGREALLQEMLAVLNEHRLVTLTGSGGVGKTRLSIQISEEVADDFSDGVWFMELAGLERPELLTQTVASFLGVREEPGRPVLTALTEFLQAKSLLLVLDNCEHLLDASARLVGALMPVCPNLRVLVTSRQPLGVTGEVTRRVPSLSLPAVAETSSLSLEQLMRYEAVRLFVERAHAAAPTFALTERNAVSTVTLCHHLDGIPLALELAAARLKALSVEQISARLDDRFRLLTGGSRSALPRQQTLRALLDWSYDLLDGQERALLHRLSVFAGGWSLEAAEAICSDDVIADWEVLDLLAQLVDKSLVVHEETGGEPRYRLLESVAQYGRDRLNESGEASLVRSRHADYFHKRVEEWNAASGGVGASEALHQIDRELENIRRSMDWVQECGDRPAVISCCKALFSFLRMRGLYMECEERLACAVAAARECNDPVSLARLLNQRGLVAWDRFQLEEAQTYFSESYEISHALGDKVRMLTSLINLGNISWGRSDFVEAQRVYETALPLAVETEQAPYEAALRQNLGIIGIERNDFAMAGGYLQQSLEMYRRQNSNEHIGQALYNISELHRRQGSYRMALEAVEESLRLYQQMGHRRGMALAEVRIGINLLEMEQSEQAEVHIEAGLQIAQEIGDQAGEMYAMDARGRLAGVQADLTGASACFRRALEIASQTGDRLQSARTLAYAGEIWMSANLLEQAYRLLYRAAREYRACGLNENPLNASLEKLRIELEPETVQRLETEADFAALASLL